MRLNNNISLDDDEYNDAFDELGKERKQDIIKGRVLNGEVPQHDDITVLVTRRDRSCEHKIG